MEGFILKDFSLVMYIIINIYILVDISKNIIDLISCEGVIYNSYRNFYRKLLTNDDEYEKYANHLKRFDENSLSYEHEELIKEIEDYTESVVRFSEEHNYDKKFYFTKNKNIILRLINISGSRYLYLLKFYYISNFEENIIWKAFADEKYLKISEEFEKTQTNIRTKINNIIERDKL